MQSKELSDAINTIQHFLDGEDGKWDWDDFISVPAQTSAVAQLQGFCRELPTLYPPVNTTEYCNSEGLTQLREILIGLKQKNL